MLRAAFAYRSEGAARLQGSRRSILVARSTYGDRACWLKSSTEPSMSRWVRSSRSANLCTCVIFYPFYEPLSREFLE